MVTTQFNPWEYGDAVAAILALDGSGQRLMPLAGGTCSCTEAHKRLTSTRAGQLFPAARSPEGSLAGLFLYFSCCRRLTRSRRRSTPPKVATGTASCIVRNRTPEIPGIGSARWGGIRSSRLCAPKPPRSESRADRSGIHSRSSVCAKERAASLVPMRRDWRSRRSAPSGSCCSIIAPAQACPGPDALSD